MSEPTNERLDQSLIADLLHERTEMRAALREIKDAAMACWNYKDQCAVPTLTPFNLGKIVGTCERLLKDVERP